jgi:hypothetical protein
MQNYNNESQIQFNFPRQNQFRVGVDIGYERVFEEEFGMKRPTGSTCAQTNTCTFWGEDSERSGAQRRPLHLCRIERKQEVQLQHVCIINHTETLITILVIRQVLRARAFQRSRNAPPSLRVYALA